MKYIYPVNQGKFQSLYSEPLELMNEGIDFSTLIICSSYGRKNMRRRWYRRFLYVPTGKFNGLSGTVVVVQQQPERKYFRIKL